MANYRKAPKLVHTGKKDSGNKAFISIPQDLLSKVFNGLQGNNGNCIKLMVWLLGTIGNKTFGISEKWITESCGFSQPAYIRARKILREMGWLELKNRVLYVNINAIRGKEVNIKDFSTNCYEIYSNTNDVTKEYIDNYFLNKCQNNDIKIEDLQYLGKDIIESDVKKYANTMVYKEYLETTYWKTISKYKKESCKNTCQICSNNKKVSVHHNKYDHRGQEHLFLNEDLVCLCDVCHKKFHDIGGEVDG